MINIVIKLKKENYFYRNIFTMSYFKGAYLQVTTPQTIDGMNLAYDANGKVVTKISHLPLSARKALEKKNAKMKEHLRHKIEEMQPYVAPPPIKVTKESKA